MNFSQQKRILKMDVFKATSVEIISVHPLIVWFSITIEYQLKCLGEDPNWLWWLQRLIWFEWYHWATIYNNEWHNFPLILPRTYQISIIWEKYFIQAAKNRAFYRCFFCSLMGPVFTQTWYFDYLELLLEQWAMRRSKVKEN